MTEEEKEAVCELKNYITKRKRSYTKLDRHDKAINNLLNLIVNLQKENTEFEKLSKDCSYSVDIVRENTRLRRQVFDLELESEKLKNTDLEQAKIEYLEVLNEKLQKENEELKGQYAEYVKLTCNELAKNSELNSESNSAIKEKNEIINKQKELIEYLRRSCDRKESCWIEEQHENVELETKLEEKDKTINAMAEYIASRDIDEDICKYINCGEGDKEREECVECVIDFFEEF